LIPRSEKKMGRVLYETAGREEGRREGRNRNEEEAERVSKFKYLSYTFNERDSEEGKQWRCAWEIGERKWGGDFRRRMMMLESMVESG
jgi:hypothetical protein